MRNASVATEDVGWGRGRRSLEEVSLADLGDRPFLDVHGHLPIEAAETTLGRQSGPRPRRKPGSGPPRCVAAGRPSPRTWTGTRRCGCPAGTAPGRRTPALSRRSGTMNSCCQPRRCRGSESATARLGQGRWCATLLLDDASGRQRAALSLMKCRGGGESHSLTRLGGGESHSSFTWRPIWTSRLCDDGDHRGDGGSGFTGRSVPSGGAMPLMSMMERRSINSICSSNSASVAA